MSSCAYSPRIPFSKKGNGGRKIAFTTHCCSVKSLIGTRSYVKTLSIFRHFLWKCRKNRGFFKQVEAQNLQNFMHALLKLQFLLYDGHQHIDADRYPNLRLHRILGGTVKSLNTQMLFDPLKE